MIEVITYLLENFSDFDHCPPHEELGKILEEIGFHNDDISDTLLFLHTLTQRKQQAAPSFKHPDSLRAYLPAEYETVPTEAIGLLHFLEQNDAITAEQREFVLMALQHLSFGHTQPDINHAKVLVLLILWADRSELPVLIGDELMSGLMQSNNLLN